LRERREREAGPLRSKMSDGLFTIPCELACEGDLKAQRQPGLPSTALRISAFIRAYPGNPWFLHHERG
jgi:hypothetical protein